MNTGEWTSTDKVELVLYILKLKIYPYLFITFNASCEIAFGLPNEIAVYVLPGMVKVGLLNNF